MNVLLRSAAVLSLVASALMAHAESVTFLETEFAPSILTTTTFINNGGTFNVSQGTSGGNPGAYQSATATSTVSGTTNFRYISIRNGFTITPSADTIQSLSFSFDEEYQNNGASIVPRTTRCLALLQGGSFYVAGASNAVADPFAFTTFGSSGLTSADFGLYDLSSDSITASIHPNFSSSGSIVQFGFLNGVNLNNVEANFTIGTKYDNLSITAQVNPVPEPSALAALGLGAVAFLRKRKRA